jgi:hypothetical protein
MARTEQTGRCQISRPGDAHGRGFRHRRINLPLCGLEVRDTDHDRGFLWRPVRRHARRAKSTGPPPGSCRPGKPTENCCLETFDESFRYGCQNAHRVEPIEDARARFRAWPHEHNEGRPQMSPGDAAPREFARSPPLECEIAETAGHSTRTDVSIYCAAPLEVERSASRPDWKDGGVHDFRDRPRSP